MNGKAFTVTSLGGVNEVGRNCFRYCYDGESIMVDCGEKILRHDDPNRHNPEYCKPDFRAIRAAGQNPPLAIFITHGHRDHLCGLPELIKQFPDMPIHASETTAALYPLHFHWRQHGDLAEQLRSQTELFSGNEIITVGPFEVWPFKVAHSIDGSYGFAIKAGGKWAVHLGDAKFTDELDCDPVQSRTYHALLELGIKPELLVMDCVNAGTPGFTPSERQAARGVSEIIGQAKGRVIVVQFATNFERLRQVTSAAKQFGKSIGFVGRSMRMAANLAVWDRTRELPYDGNVILATGSQAESGGDGMPGSALWRAAMDDTGEDNKKPRLRIQTGDTVVFSSRAIPQNRPDVKALVEQLRHVGARVILHKGESAKLSLEEPMEERFVHASGHGYDDDLRLFYATLQPKRVLANHAEPATLAKVPVTLPDAKLIFPKILEEIPIE